MSASNETTSTERIRTLNDHIRRNIGSGRAVMTIGIAALGPEVVARIIKTIEVFDDFCTANDPHEEHDFGAVEVDGNMIFFKIDYYESQTVNRQTRQIQRLQSVTDDHAG